MERQKKQVNSVFSGQFSPKISTGMSVGNFSCQELTDHKLTLAKLIPWHWLNSMALVMSTMILFNEAKQEWIKAIGLKKSLLAEDQVM